MKVTRGGQLYKSPSERGNTGGTFLSKSPTSIFSGLLGAPRMWERRALIAPLRKPPAPAPKVKGPAPVKKPTACYSGCGQVFESRNAAGRHAHWCFASREGAD